MANDKCNDKALLKELFDIICEVVCVKRKMIKVGGVVYRMSMYDQSFWN